MVIKNNLSDGKRAIKCRYQACINENQMEAAEFVNYHYPLTSFV